jgi:hypothetical protein
MTTPDIPALVARLKEKQAALPDLRDCTSDNAKALNYSDRVTIQSVISGLQNIDHDLDKPERLLADLEVERTAVLAEQACIEAEQAKAPPPARSSIDVDREHDRQQHLRRRLELLHRGELLKSPGVAYMRLTDLDARISELRQKIDRLHAKHAAFVDQATALLGATVTT